MPTLDDRSAARRLLDRFGFGPRPGELDAAAARGFDATLAAMLAPADDAGAKATPPPDLGAEPQQLGNNKDQQAKKQAEATLQSQETKLTAWWLDRMVATEAPLTERLTWFWHGHFATSVQKVRSAKMMLAQNQTQRRLATGDFTALAKAMIADPAMLVWLDGGQNRKGAANENLAREFMELFTLGIGHYTETDVREAARALTGWHVDRLAGTATFVPKQHDTGTKTVLGTTAPLDANSLVDVLLARPDSPKFIAQRVWFRLVSGDPVPADALDRLVAAYGPHRDVAALLRAVAAEPAFRDQATSLVKQPVEWLVGLLRAVRLQPAGLPDAQRTQLLGALRGLGQIPFAPPSVGGWAAGGAWLSTSAGLARLQLAQLVAAHADLSGLAGLSASARVDGVRALLGVDAWTDRTKAALQKVDGDAKKILAVAACAPEYVVSA
ncbi:DUF1800 domain-containing protein [Solihabitans fulvus]|uniref:DUF1800 domain-containing protein n=1 Tax=Solihabitans fulvus TaxID=1892852 RepID=A0A5B2WPZ8_9PSEU|nr:DUF1800 domain-containing protein [Solihabitans fulvus]KAA2253018.1 DUF1800 domain-containing protein [Solihabitans fulvus]